jgi:hypothetical protein
MERKAEKEINRQQAAAKVAAKRATHEQMEAHEAAMAAHLAQQDMAAAPTAEATNEEAIAAGHAAMEAATGAGSSAHVLDRTAHQPVHATTTTKDQPNGRSSSGSGGPKAKIEGTGGHHSAPATY